MSGANHCNVLRRIEGGRCVTMSNHGLALHITVCLCLELELPSGSTMADLLKRLAINFPAANLSV